jgi:amino acid transporter
MIELVGFWVFLAAVFVVGLLNCSGRVPYSRATRLVTWVLTCFAAAIFIACIVFVIHNPEVADFNGP